MASTVYFLYLLLCSDGSLYTGISPHPRHRFRLHQLGKGGAYTRSHPPVKLVYTEPLPDKSSALRREAEIKSWSRQKKILSLGLPVSSAFVNRPLSRKSRLKPR